jgi:hypothetical protein
MSEVENFHFQLAFPPEKELPLPKGQVVFAFPPELAFPPENELPFPKGRVVLAFPPE